jgi:selenocysteine-specific elongation factor
MSVIIDPPTEPPACTLVIATAGHVDHGKTSLVRLLSGTDTDTLAEEKTRGLTINLGYAYSHSEILLNGTSRQCTLGFVDVPGHIDFIGNMLAGVGAIDYALLVVAADDGIMPQTREHLAILHLLGISKGTVVITKIDRVDEQRLESVKLAVRTLLEGKSLENAPVLQVSSSTGEGIEELSSQLQTAALEQEAELAGVEKHQFRYLIDRSFVIKGIGTVVTGTARSGSVTPTARLVHTGSGKPVKLRGLRVDNNEVAKLQTGQRAACSIDLSQDLIKRGDWLLAPELYHPAHRLDVLLTLLDADCQLKSSSQYHLYLGASHHIVTIRKLGESPRQFYQITSHTAVYACYGDRFVIRDPASTHTLGGGLVIDVFVPRKNRSSAERLQLLNAMDQEPLAALQAMSEISSNGIDLRQFQINRNLSDTAIQHLLTAMTSTGFPMVLLQTGSQKSPFLLLRQFYKAHSEGIFQQIADFHQRQPNQQGISEPALSKATDFSGPHAIFHAILQKLIEEKSVFLTGTQLHLPQHKARLSEEETEFLNKIRPLLLTAGKVAPRTRELVEMTGIPLKVMERILRQTTLSGNLVQIAPNRHYLPETVIDLAEFTEQLAAQASTDEGFSVIEFRDAAGIGRNLCIEILEYFDRVGFTRRDGNTRFLRTDKVNIFRA